MASEVKKRSTRSTSRSRSTKQRSSKSKSRSRTRSRSRSRSRGRSPARQQTKKTTKATTPERSTKIRPSTPTRMSARLAAKTESQPSKDPQLQQNDASTKKSSKSASHNEFGGSVGAFSNLFFLPATVFYINMACTKKSCTIMKVPFCSGKWSDFFDLEATLIFYGWLLFQAVLYMLPVGRVVNGQPLIIGNHARLPYRCNGFFAFVMSCLVFGGALYYKLPVTIVYDKFQQIMTTAVVSCFLFSVLLYVKSRFARASAIAPAGNSGNIIYDFFMGRELNPRIGSFDLKFFCTLRPGLIGWTMINLVFLVKDYKEDGQLNYSLTLVAFFQALFVADNLWFEEAILTTMDIIYDGFGFMLCFADLAWVPFLYCLQGRYLLEHPNPLPWYYLACIAVLNGIGYFIYRGSNSQKNEFRKNPNNPALAHLESIPTKKNKRLLVTGWWGLCRKPNYLGDLIMALSWSLPCGFSTILPYFYPIYLLILLVHRERRDDAACKAKYQESWDKYCQRVKYRIFPKIY